MIKINLMKKKECRICCEMKEKSEFYVNKRNNTYIGECKKCKIKRSKKWKENNEESVKKSKKKWKENNEEFLKNYNKQRYIDNIEHRKELRYQNRIRRNELKKQRRKNDIFFKLRQIVSNRIGKYLKQNNGSKRGFSILEYLPYTIQQLKDHLEKQFDSNMSWENYGSYWHIDHIYPQSKLPYNSYDHPNFQKCWALENLRPLEAIENMKKGNKNIMESINV